MTEEGFFYKPFSHVYVERRAMDREITEKILERLPGAALVPVDSYMDLFGRKKQNPAAARRNQALILAVKEGELIYPGAPVCQDFGNSHFYYTSCEMNCLFDCEYCFLKGMYPSGYHVIFVNIEDYFEKTEELLRRHPLYLCVSYDSDLMASERLTGYVRLWSEFTGRHAGKKGTGRLLTEIRTKSAPGKIWEELTPYKNVIFAFTLSPAGIIERYEHGTPSLSARIESAAKALDRGFPVRLCFDPIIVCSSWREAYADMVSQVSSSIDMRKLVDVSVGSFRISAEYLGRMRRAMPGSALVQYPYEISSGYYHYPRKLMEDMEGFLTGQLAAHMDKEQIFRWDNQ